MTGCSHLNSPRTEPRYIIVTYQAANEKGIVSDNRFLSTFFSKQHDHPGQERPHTELRNLIFRSKIKPPALKYRGKYGISQISEIPSFFFVSPPHTHMFVRINSQRMLPAPSLYRGDYAVLQKLQIFRILRPLPTRRNTIKNMCARNPNRWN